MTLHFFRMSQQELPAVLRRTIRLLNIYEENQRKQQQPITMGIINYKRKLHNYATKNDITQPTYINTKTGDMNTVTIEFNGLKETKSGKYKIITENEAALKILIKLGEIRIEN